MEILAHRSIHDDRRMISSIHNSRFPPFLLDSDHKSINTLVKENKKLPFQKFIINKIEIHIIFILLYCFIKNKPKEMYVYVRDFDLFPSLYS